VLLTPHVVRLAAEPEAHAVRKSASKLRPAVGPIPKSLAAHDARSGRPTAAAPRAAKPTAAAAKSTAGKRQRPKEPPAKPAVAVPKPRPTDIVRTAGVNAGVDADRDAAEPGIESIPVLELPTEYGRPLIVPGTHSAAP